MRALKPLVEAQLRTETTLTMYGEFHCLPRNP